MQSASLCCLLLLASLAPRGRAPAAAVSALAVRLARRSAINPTARSLGRYCRLRMSDSEQYDVVVVGGGAAGIFGAIAAARAGASVLCLEGGSQPLRKVRISGGGRCNVMHDAQTWQASRDAVAQRYPRGADQLLGSLASRFSPEETQAHAHAHAHAHVTRGADQHAADGRLSRRRGSRRRVCS